jgi:uncharacterized membrane protein YhhN
VVAPILFAVVAVVAAPVNWWSRAGEGRRAVECCTKPLVSGCVLGIAVLVQPAYAVETGWFLAAFACCVVGDVVLLADDRWFLAGLGAFAVAHGLFAVGMLSTDALPGAGAKVVVILTVVALVVVVAPRVIAGAARQAPALAAGVGVYVALIATMAVVAAIRGTDRAAAGAVCFVLSDAMLGWSRFVGRFRGDRVAVMVSYHLALAGLVSSLWP